MKIVADIHTHTIASGHAYSTVKENIEQALCAGLEYLGFSDHTPGMPNTTSDSYFYNLKVIRDTVGGLRVLKGAEANIVDSQGRIDVPRETVSELDYVIASLHDLVTENMGITANTQSVIQAMKNPCVRVIGHPDDARFPLDYKALTVAAKAMDVALELNNSSLSPNSSRPGAHENARRMLEQCKRTRTAIIVGSDSHIWYEVGEFSNALFLLEQCDFPSELVINANTISFERFMNLSGDAAKFDETAIAIA